MAKTLQVRLEEGLRSEASDVLSRIGLDLPTAVRLFLTQVVQTRSIPFALTAGEDARVERIELEPATQAKWDALGARLMAKRKRTG